MKKNLLVALVVLGLVVSCGAKTEEAKPAEQATATAAATPAATAEAVEFKAEDGSVLTVTGDTAKIKIADVETELVKTDAGFESADKKIVVTMDGDNYKVVVDGKEAVYKK